MKRKCSLFLLAVGCLFAWTQDVNAEDEAGRVLAVKRDVYLIHQGEQNPARARTPFFLNDAVATGKQSRTKLFFRDDSVLNMAELSKVQVDTYLYTDEKARSKSICRLVEGSLRAVVGRTNLEIHTPTAVVAARGTKFIVSLSGKGDSLETEVLVLEGEVEVKGLIDTFQGVETVRAGRMTRVRLGKPLPSPLPLLPQILQQRQDRIFAIGNVHERVADRIDLPGVTGGQGSLSSGRTGPLGRGRAKRRGGLAGQGSPGRPTGILETIREIKNPPFSQEPARALTPVILQLEFPER